MKKLHKIVSLLLVAALLLTGSNAALASSITAEEITLTGLNDLSVRQAASDYMDTRADFLLGKTDSMNWVITGIGDDEVAHLEKCKEEGIVLKSSSYSIGSVECYDTEAYATVNEIVTYTKDGVAGTEQVVHEMTVIYDDNGTFVLSDRYIEDFSGFESCSYVPPMAENSINAVGSTAGSASCIINIALGQEGYTETGENITKYAKELETTQTKWCSIFIRWCAYKANISENIVPLEPLCVELRKFYTNANLYYTKESGYTPQPGDIFFKLTSEGNHVGIVEKVEGNLVWIIHGNASDMVRHNTMNLNSTEILGYAHPAYENTGHTVSDYTCTSGLHSGSCINCGAEIEEAHNLVCVELNSNNHQEVCTVCQYVASTSGHIMGTVLKSDSTNHWYECGGCGYKESVEAHSCGAYQSNSTGHWKICNECGAKCSSAAHNYYVSLDGTKVCKVCGYEGPTSSIMNLAKKTAMD